MDTMPNNVDANWEADDYNLAKEMVQFGISLAEKRTIVKEEFEKNYNAYHGDYTAAEKLLITDINGQPSKTEFVGMKFAKVKLDRLIGEAIELNFQAEVTTVNKDAVLKKAKEISKAKGRSLMKPFIEQAQQKGHDIYSGVNIPDYGDEAAWDPKNFRTNNERIMEILLQKKLKDPEADYIYPMLFISAIFTSEIHSIVVDRGNGDYFVQPIPSEQMVFMETGLDNQSGNSPIIGHWELMSFGDCIKRFDIDAFHPQYKKIKDYFNGASVNDESTKGKGAYKKVYFFQWRIYKTKWFVNKNENYEDITKEYNENEALRKQVEADIENKKYGLNRVVLESIYQGASIGGDVFIGFKEVENQIKDRNYKNKYRVRYDYTTTLIKTIGNKRTPYAAVMLELNKQYDYIWWLIRKNIKKLKSGIIYVDEAALGRKTLNNFLYEIEEMNVARINSASESLSVEFDDAKKVIGAFQVDTGVHNVLNSLLTISSSVENAMNTLTGINDAREGIEKATTTATTNQSNLRASRSVTYDLFYFTQKHEEIAMTKILQKEKLAIAMNPEDYQFLDENDSTFVKATSEIAFDDFMARVTDGKKEHDIKNDIDMYLPQEVNAGRIGTSDVVKFKIAPSFAEAVKVLDDATRKTDELAQQTNQQKNETQMQVTKQNNDAMLQDREDTQAHEKELTNIVESNKIRLKQMDVNQKLLADREKNMTAIYTASKKEAESKKTKNK